MRVIETSSVSTNESLYSLLRITGLYCLAALEEENPDPAIEALLALMPKIKPLLKPLGITAADANLFVRQIRFWHSGDLDWDNSLHARRFESGIETFFLYLLDIFIETDDEDLTDTQLSLKQNFDPAELSMLHGMLGFILGLSRRYNSAKFINTLMRASSILFKEDKELYWQFASEGDKLADDGYEKPADYNEQRKQLLAILARNKIETCEGDDYLATFKGLIDLKEKNPEEANQYTKIRNFLNREALRAVIGDIVFDNMGEPQRWSNVYNRLTRSSVDIYLPLNKMPNGAWTGMIQVLKNANGEDAVQFLSPYGEPLKQVAPIGNVVMNPNYVQGSSEFVARYIVPNSQALTPVYVYTLAAAKAKNAARSNQTRQVLTNLDTYRSRWLKDLKTFDTQMEKYYAALLKPRSKPKPPTTEQWTNGILAMLCEIGYQAAPRTGEKGTSSMDESGKRVPTYALTSLKIKHLLISPPMYHPALWGSDSKHEDGLLYPATDIKEVAFSYKGKAAEPQFHEFTLNGIPADGDMVSHKLLMKLLTKYIANLSFAYATQGDMSRDAINNQQLFRIPAVRSSQTALVNEWVIVLNRHVNSYLKKRIKFDGTFKMFRKLKATKVFMDYMDQCSLDETNIESHVLQGAALAGKALGHAAAKRKATGTMALQFYIEVNTVLDYYKSLSVNPSKRIATLIKDNIADSKV